MNHSYFIDRLSAFHDRDLPAQELQIVEEHVRTCPDCQEQLVRFNRLETFVKVHMPLKDDAYWEQLAHRTEQRLGFTAGTATPVSAKPSRITPLWRYAALAASVVLVGFIGLHYSDIMTGVEKKSSTPAAPVVADSTRSDTPPVAPLIREPLPTGSTVPPPVKSETQEKPSDKQVVSSKEDLARKPERVEERLPAAEIESDAAIATRVDSPFARMPRRMAHADESAQSARPHSVDTAFMPAPEESRRTATPMATAADNVADTLATQLARLRTARDSVTSALDAWERLKKSYGVSPTLVPKTSLDAIAGREDRPDSLKSLLLNIHGELARVSPDTLEQRTSLEYLESVAAGKDAELARRADSLLMVLRSRSVR